MKTMYVVPDKFFVKYHKLTKKDYDVHNIEYI